MSVLSDFIAEQIFNFISGRMLDHAYTSAKSKAELKYMSNLLSEQMNDLEKIYHDTVVDTDCFFIL